MSGPGGGSATWLDFYGRRFSTDNPAGTPYANGRILAERPVGYTAGVKTTPSTPFLEKLRRRTSRFSLTVVAVTACGLALSPQQGLALPTGGQLVAGQVTATVNGTQLTLDQASRAAIMNWSQFNIAPNELVRILQSSPDAAMLARVTGGDPSQLLGRLQTDGRLFLINPKGIVVGQGAVIDTAAFLASTLDVADADFLKGGPLTFQGDSAAGVVNLGKITAREGNVLLLAHTVKNGGEISAAKGTTGLGSGTEVYLASPDAPVFVVRTNLPATTEQTGVDNSGVITAAQAQLEAAGGGLFDLAVNHTGRVQATGVEHRPDGRILLTAAGGNVLVTGSATARAADGSGGEILVGGDYQGKNAAVANAANTQVAASAALDASAAVAAGDGGRIIVWADNATRFDGTLAARAGAQGGYGGFAEVSGKRSLGFAGAVDLAAPAGARGRLLLDPDEITIIPGAVAAPPGLADRIWLSSEDGASQVLGADTLTGLLATADVFMQAGSKLQVDAPVIVAAGGASGVQLSLQAPTVTLNETVSLANVTNGRIQILTDSGTLSSASGATLAASKIYIGGMPTVTLNGPVSTSELVYNSLGAPASFIATNPANAVAKFTLNTDEADPQAVTFSGNVAVHSSTAMELGAMIGGANNVTFSSAGDLTVLGTTAITASGTTKLASTGGVLINQAGASFLAGAGRRLLYTSDTTGAFNLGGLTGYTQVDGVSYPSDPNGAVTLVLYNAAGGGPTLTLTITANDFIKLYGQADPTFTASYAGGTVADLLALPSFSIQQGTHVNVGTYTIVPSGATSGTHAIDYVNGTLRIDPATLTYVANAASRLYGDANPVFSGTVTGFVNGDTLASATTGTLAFTSPASAVSNAGSHAINGGGLTANHGNYMFQDASANLSALTVNKAPLTVTFADATRTYGAANPEFTPSFAGFRNGDTAVALSGFVWGTAATAASGVGTYEIGASGASGVPNYAITVKPGTLTITRAPLTFRVNDLTTVYGDEIPTPGYTVTGLVGGDTAAVLNGVSFGSAFFNTTDAGTYALNFASTGTAQNYAVTQVIPGTLTVAPAPLVFRVNDLTTFYGETIPTPGFTLTGLRGLDTASVLSGVSFGSAFFSTTPVGSYALNYASTGTAKNYVVSQYIPGTLDVTRRSLTITADNVIAFAGSLPAVGYTAVGWTPGMLGVQVRLDAFQKVMVYGEPALRPVTLSNDSPAGEYVIRPVVTSGGALQDATYDIRLVEGTVTLTPDYTKATIIISTQNISLEPLKKTDQILKEYEENKNKPQVVVGGGYKPGNPVPKDNMAAMLRNLQLVRTSGIMQDILKDRGLDRLLTPQQRTLFNELTSFTNSNARMNPKLYENNHDAQVVLAMILTLQISFNIVDANGAGAGYSPSAEYLPIVNRASVLLDQLRNEKLKDVISVEPGADNIGSLYMDLVGRDAQGWDRLNNLVQNPTNSELSNLNTKDQVATQELFIAMLQLVKETYGP